MPFDSIIIPLMIAENRASSGWGGGTNIFFCTRTTSTPALKMAILRAAANNRPEGITDALMGVCPVAYARWLGLEQLLRAPKP